VEPTTLPVDRMFPTLTPDQIARIEAHGRRRPLSPGDLLIERGAPSTRFFVVCEGGLEVLGGLQHAADVVATVGPGQFTGEVGLLSGRPAFFDIRVRSGGTAIEVEQEQMLALVQVDTDLSDLLLRAFIVRRVELFSRGLGDVVLVGSSHSAGTQRIREFLTRNAHPHFYVDVERDKGVQELLDNFAVSAGDVPIVICRGTIVLKNPSNERIADCLGLNEPLDREQVHDLVVVGAGPSGLAAAVYGASEGLDVMVLEASAPGGQAGSSSKIENYLGFPTGISGQELAGAAYTQAQKFGAHVTIAKTAARLTCDRQPFAVETDDGARIKGRMIIIATGAHYRRLPIEELPRFEGLGVYYGATFVEAQWCGGDEVIVVGGGNSAGQAAVYLTETAAKVHMLVRSGGLEISMSRYLIRRIEESPKIELHTRTEVIGVDGAEHLERVVWRNSQTGETTERPIRHLFVMTGAVPNTAWLDGCIALDAKGFIKTGTDLTPDDLDHARWAVDRPPYLLETSRPGVFAAGDVRSGNVKRVASAVGEGSIAVALVHQLRQR
jgi:thioredoxin reductase (NADPH)